MKSASIALLATFIFLAPAAGMEEKDAPHPVLTSLSARFDDYLARRFPDDPWISMEKDRLVVRRRTQEFLVHASYKTGQISEDTRREEGPGHRGFLLRISVQEGAWAARSPLVLPQTIRLPYWKLHIGSFGLRDRDESLAVYLSWNRSCPHDVLERLLRIIAEDPGTGGAARARPCHYADPADGIRPELIAAKTFPSGGPVELLLAYHHVGTALRLLWLDGGASNPKKPAPLMNVEMIHVTRLGEKPESFRLAPRAGNSRGQRLTAMMPRQTVSQRTVINTKMWRARSETTERVVEGPLALTPGRYRVYFTCVADRWDRFPPIDGKWRDPLEGVEHVWKGPRLVSNSVEFTVE